MNLIAKQSDIKDKIIGFSTLFGIDPVWAISIAMTESSLGYAQVSHTGCKGVFQMSSIAMKDLLNSMEADNEDLIDIACGVAFLYLLLKRWKTIEEATNHFCDPADRTFYLDRVLTYMKVFKDDRPTNP